MLHEHHLIKLLGKPYLVSRTIHAVLKALVNSQMPEKQQQIQKVSRTRCCSFNEPGTDATEIKPFEPSGNIDSSAIFTALHWLWLKSVFFKEHPVKLLGRRGRQKNSTFNAGRALRPQSQCHRSRGNVVRSNYKQELLQMTLPARSTRCVTE